MTDALTGIPSAGLVPVGLFGPTPRAAKRVLPISPRPNFFPAGATVTA